jgi:hypothetical protein
MKEQYIKAKKIVEAYEDKENPFKISFWFMLSNHTFYKLKVNSLDELEKSAIEAVKLDGYGMLCYSRLVKNEIEMDTIGQNFHGTAGVYDIKGWVDSIKNDLKDINYIIDKD